MNKKTQEKIEVMLAALFSVLMANFVLWILFRMVN